MSDAPRVSPEAQSRLTGAPSGKDFMRACYVVRDHGDGTGTVALDWYEMSDGRDYGTSEVFMRTELSAAIGIVELLNTLLPFRVHAATHLDWRDQ
jgi:hypothetical protein